MRDDAITVIVLLRIKFYLKPPSFVEYSRGAAVFAPRT